MPDRLRRIVFSVPVIAIASLFALYVVGGYFALPALVKWQIEKQAPDRLAHRIGMSELRFDPFALRLEADDFVLSDLEGNALLEFKRLRADLELRSLIDRAWTFSQIHLQAPVVHFDLRKDGTHNFAALLERIIADEPSDLPPVVATRFELTDGRVEYTDRLLDEPLVARFDPLTFEVDRLSTLPTQKARYRFAARTGAGETIEASGELSLTPIASKGRLSLNDAKVATLARALSRLLDVHSPEGAVRLSAVFDLGLDAHGRLAGTAQEVEFEIGALSAGVSGAGAPLVRVETVALEGGRVDLAKRAVSFDAVRVAKGSIAAAVDDAKTLNWSRFVRTQPPSAAAASPARDAPGPWRIAIANVDVSAVSLDYADPAAGRSARVAAFAFAGAPRLEVGPGETRVDFGKPRLSIDGAQLADGADRLALQAAVFEAEGLALNAAPGGIELSLAAPRAAAPGGFSAQRGESALENRGISVQGGRLVLTVAGERIDLVMEAPALASPGTTSARQGGASVEIGAVEWQGARMALNGLNAHLSGTLDDARFSLATLVGKADGRDLKVGKSAFTGKRFALNTSQGGYDFGIEQPRGEFAAVQVRRGKEALDLRTALVTLERISIAQKDGRTRASGTAASASVSGMAGRQGADRVALQEGAFQAKAVSAAVGAPVGASGATPKSAAGDVVRLQDAALKLTALGVVAGGATTEIARLGSGNLGAGTLMLGLAPGPLDVAADAWSAVLKDGRLRNPEGGTELLRFTTADAAGGTLRVKEQTINADKLAVSGGSARLRMNAKGELDWLSLLPSAAAPTPAQAHAKPWRVVLKSAQVDDFAVAYADARESPVLEVGLQAIRARIADLDTGAAKPMQVDFAAGLASGGQIAANGSVSADSGLADLQVSATKVALAPVQTYLSRIARLQLADGTVSGAGRLRYADEAGAKSKIAYQGSLKVGSLRIEETEPRRPFLAADSVETDDLVLSLQPNRLDIGVLRLEGPSGRLVIAEDQSANIMQILKKPAADAPSASQADEAETFPVTIARIGLTGGSLDFADLSLRPKFGIRMHELKGVITGLGNDPNRSAKVQLDARVDKYSAARIRGEISVVQPEKFTDVDMSFRNLAMTTLSPYVAKFAGYKVASGRLALDLKYKVRDAKLVGENKIVLNQLELGEKVESPDALDLPIELALAILKDPDGVIDIGVPVSGDLSDPKFDYAEVIGKAVGNLLGGIVTAPFRALGSMFAQGADAKLGLIEFEPGSAAIAPPEHQKLEAVARALQERPTLTLVVPPAYAVAIDTPVLKSFAVRRDIVGHMGVELKPGEDPGPIDTANPRVQRAVEAAFGKRYAPEVFDALRRRALEGPPIASAGAKTPAVPSTAGPAAGSGAAAQPAAVPPPGFYQGLVERLIKEEPVSEKALAQLANRRGHAIVHQLTALGGAPANRVVMGEPGKAVEASEGAVTLKLKLEVAK